MRPKVLIRQFENPLFEFGRDMSSIGFDIVGRIVLPDRRNMNRVPSSVISAIHMHTFARVSFAKRQAIGTVAAGTPKNGMKMEFFRPWSISGK